MGLFNNVRRHIVHKLIRPEDGYTFTGFSEGQPLKFYYQEDTGKYLVGRRSDNWYYFEPTLSGWHSYASRHLPWGTTQEKTRWNPVTKQMEDHTYGQEPQEIDFQKWIYGIMDNIFEQYSGRIDEITAMLRGPRRLNDFKKNQNGEKLMINKQSFCDIMNALDKYWDNFRVLEEVLDVVFESNFLTDIYDSVIMALEEDMEPDIGDDEEHMIYRWLLEFDAGRSDKAKEGIDGHPLTTAEELYDYLVWKQGEREHGAD